MEPDVRMGGNAVLKLFSQRELDITPILDGLLADQISHAHPSITLEQILGMPGRCDHLLQRLANGPIPSSLCGMGFDHTFLAGQFSTPLVDHEVDVVVLSAASDLRSAHWVHGAEGWIVNPPVDWRTAWPDELRRRFETAFEETSIISAEEYSSTMRDVIAKVREISRAHVVLFGASTLGEDLVSSYFEKEDDHRLRVHRINAAQIRLSMALGVSVLDVDRVIANIGGAGTVTGPLEYTTEAQTAIAEDLVYVLRDIGFFETRPLVAQIGQEWGRA